MELTRNQQIAFRCLKQVFALALLMLYSASAVKVDSFHQLLHSTKTSELHSAAQEKNPCHKSIYHQQSEEGCAHQSHVGENDKCPWCECNSTSGNPVFPGFEGDIEINDTDYSASYQENFTSSSTYSFTQRGPPLLA